MPEEMPDWRAGAGAGRPTSPPNRESSSPSNGCTSILPGKVTVTQGCRHKTPVHFSPCQPGRENRKFIKVFLKLHHLRLGFLIISKVCAPDTKNCFHGNWKIYVFLFKRWQVCCCDGVRRETRDPSEILNAGTHLKWRCEVEVEPGMFGGCEACRPTLAWTAQYSPALQQDPVQYLRAV